MDWLRKRYSDPRSPWGRNWKGVIAAALEMGVYLVTVWYVGRWVVEGFPSVPEYVARGGLILELTCFLVLTLGRFLAWESRRHSEPDDILSRKIREQEDA